MRQFVKDNTHDEIEGEGSVCTFIKFVSVRNCATTNNGFTIITSVMGGNILTVSLNQYTIVFVSPYNKTNSPIDVVAHVITIT